MPLFQTACGTYDITECYWKIKILQPLSRFYFLLNKILIWPFLRIKYIGVIMVKKMSHYPMVQPNLGAGFNGLCHNHIKINIWSAFANTPFSLKFTLPQEVLYSNKDCGVRITTPCGRLLKLAMRMHTLRAQTCQDHCPSGSPFRLYLLTVLHVFQSFNTVTVLPDIAQSPEEAHFAHVFY